MLLARKMLAVLALLLLPAAAAAAVPLFTSLYNFQSAADGWQPNPILASDAQGNLYGTTRFGGANSRGTVLKFAPDGSKTILHHFGTLASGDGGIPGNGVIRDPSGNLYGVTNVGGTSQSGTIFRIAPDGSETVLYSFSGGADGRQPGSLVMDDSGNLYGTALSGGNARNFGTVFKLASDGTFTVLHTFQGGPDGANPVSVTVDTQGNLYGITRFGGNTTDTVNIGKGNGLVFTINAAGVKSVLYTFDGVTAGFPQGALIRDDGGNLYGATGRGTNNFTTYGIVYKLAPDGTLTALHTFDVRYSRGRFPNNIVMDGAGNIFGTTEGGPPHSKGAVVFELVKKTGKQKILYNFGNKSLNTYSPNGLIIGADGALYGTTEFGGAAMLGTIYRIVP